MRRGRGGISLHGEIPRSARNAVLIRRMVYDRNAAVEIVVRRRSGGGPLERGGFPRIVACLGSFEDAPEQVEQEDELRTHGDESRIGDELVEGKQRSQIMDFRELRVATWLTGHAEVMHGHEDRVGANQGEAEVNLAQAFVHHAAKHLGHPVISSSEDAEDGGHTHDQVEVGGYEGRVVQRYVESWLSQERSAESAGHEQGNEADGEQHRRVEANASAP